MPRLGVEAVADRATGPAAQAGEVGEFGDDVGHYAPGRVGGGGGPEIGHEVEQRRVGLVADRGDDRRAGGGDGADQRLVGERQQVLQRPPAAGDDDHVDVAEPVE